MALLSAEVLVAVLVAFSVVRLGSLFSLWSLWLFKLKILVSVGNVPSPSSSSAPPPSASSSSSSGTSSDPASSSSLFYLPAPPSATLRPAAALLPMSRTLFLLEGADRLKFFSFLFFTSLLTTGGVALLLFRSGSSAPSSSTPDLPSNSNLYSSSSSIYGSSNSGNSSTTSLYSSLSHSSQTDSRSSSGEAASSSDVAGSDVEDSAQNESSYNISRSSSSGITSTTLFVPMALLSLTFVYLVYLQVQMNGRVAPSSPRRSDFFRSLLGAMTGCFVALLLAKDSLGFKHHLFPSPSLSQQLLALAQPFASAAAACGCSTFETFKRRWWSWGVRGLVDAAGLLGFCCFLAAETASAAAAVEREAVLNTIATAKGRNVYIHPDGRAVLDRLRLPLGLESLLPPLLYVLPFLWLASAATAFTNLTGLPAEVYEAFRLLLTAAAAFLWISRIRLATQASALLPLRQLLPCDAASTPPSAAVSHSSSNSSNSSRNFDDARPRTAPPAKTVESSAAPPVYSSAASAAAGRGKGKTQPSLRDGVEAGIALQRANRTLLLQLLQLLQLPCKLLLLVCCSSLLLLYMRLQFPSLPAFGEAQQQLLFAPVFTDKPTSCSSGAGPGMESASLLEEQQWPQQQRDVDKEEKETLNGKEKLLRPATRKSVTQEDLVHPVHDPALPAGVTAAAEGAAAEAKEKQTDTADTPTKAAAETPTPACVFLLLLCGNSQRREEAFQAVSRYSYKSLVAGAREDAALVSPFSTPLHVLLLHHLIQKLLLAYLLAAALLLFAARARIRNDPSSTLLALWNAVPVPAAVGAPRGGMAQPRATAAAAGRALP